MIKIAIAGSRRMSSYGREMIDKIMEKLANFEVATIRVAGCNQWVIKKGAKKVFEYSGEDFEKVNDDLAEYASILIVIEGDRRSGTMLLAKKFVEKGKRVLALPGRINDGGSFVPNWLISQGAEILVDVEDLTEVLQ